MIYWLLVAILAYLFFGMASLFDKLVLDSKPKPKSYTFYVGVFSLFVILFIPFIDLSLPSAGESMWIILDSTVHIAGLYAMFVAVERFAVSKVIATIGATQPMFIFILTWFFWGPQAIPAIDIAAFLLLLLGSVIISVEKNMEVTSQYLKITIFSSLMFSLDYIFSKMVFLSQPFMSGIIWIRIAVFLLVLLFIINKNSRKEIFSRRMVLDKKIQANFLYAQLCGGVANFLQSFAISLAPIALLAVVNSLRGVQYVFLFLTTFFVSYFFPKILKEELSERIIYQKIISISLIAIGLAILSV